MIKDRIREALKQCGKGDRILFESGDLSREQETMPDVFKRLYTDGSSAIDRFLGVNEQVQTVQLLKNMPTEEKLYQWITGSMDLDPNLNFRAAALAYADTTDFDHMRKFAIPEAE